MFDSFKESLLENSVSSQPEPQLIYRIPQTRESGGDSLEGELYFVLECRHARTKDKRREILQIRLTPLAWLENAPEQIYSRSVWYNKKRTGGWFDTFQLCADHDEKIVRFGPSGNLLISEKELRGLGIGTYAWRILIKWARKRFPRYKVHRIRIASKDATEDNLDRRNHFFLKHGFKPFYENAEGRDGWFGCDKVSDLQPSIFTPAWKHVNSIEMIAELLKEKERLECQIRAMPRNVADWFIYYDRALAEQKRLKKISFVSAISFACLLGFYLFVFNNL